MHTPRADTPEDASEEEGRRVLIIDDNPAIHDDLRKILRITNDPPPGPAGPGLRAFFAESPSLVIDPPPPAYEIRSAYQGEDGVALAAAALAASAPFALAFVDGRMPPGQDGIETCRRLWEIQPDLQIVLCSAYSDYRWEDIRRVLGPGANLVILRKPFDVLEIQQLADTLTGRWLSVRDMHRRLEALNSLCETARPPATPDASGDPADPDAEAPDPVAPVSPAAPAECPRHLASLLTLAEADAARIGHDAKDCKIKLLLKLAALLREHRDQLGAFGEKLPAVLAQLAVQMETERKHLLRHARLLDHHLRQVRVAAGAARPPAPPSRPPA